jgi:hypothetical protein
MAENLRTTTYNDGTPIPYVESKVEWDSLTTGAYCWYNNNAEGYADDPRGALYNWCTVRTGKDCPAYEHYKQTRTFCKIIYKTNQNINHEKTNLPCPFNFL